MRRRNFLSALFGQSILAVTACGMSGCGTLMHNERVGQPHSHQIDWKVAALDGLGMLLFFVPGIAAFAVDFYTGAIYLPIEETYSPHSPPAQQYGLPAVSTTQPAAPGNSVLATPGPSSSVSHPAPHTGAPYNFVQPTPAHSATGAPGTTGQAPQPLPLGPPANSTPLPTGTLPPPPRVGLKRIEVPREQLEPRNLERVVSNHLGRPVSLADERARVSVLPELDAFDQQARRHREDRRFGVAIKTFFARFQRNDERTDV